MRRIVLELADDTTETECQGCPGLDGDECHIFGRFLKMTDGVAHRGADCIAAERTASRLLDVSPEDAASWAYGYWPNEGRKMVCDALVEHAKKAEVKP